MQALFYPLLGPVEWAARLPNWIASLLLVPLTAVKARAWFNNKSIAIFAASFIASSPLAIQFSPTAFTDPLLTLWLWLSLPVQNGRFPLKFGLFFGLALLTKHQAWLFLPLIIGLGWHAGWQRHAWQRWLFGWLPAILLLVGWEVVRSGTFGLWTRTDRQFWRFAVHLVVGAMASFLGMG